MITKWKVSNFKSIREETELDIGPLTIFAGANSSGKSTFIQSVLLVAQTLANKVSSRSVVLNGALSSLGQFDDLKSSGGEVDQISIKCTCRPLPNQDGTSPRYSQIAARRAMYYSSHFDRLQEIACEMAFDAGKPSNSDLFQIQPRLFATQLSCVSRDEDNVDQKADISIHHSNKLFSEIEGADSANEIDDQLHAGLDYAVELDEDSMLEVEEEYRSARPIGCMLRHFLPERIILAIDTMAEDANAITAALRDGGRWFIGFRRSAGRDILLSKEIVAVLREVLKGTPKLDNLFRIKHKQSSQLGSDSGTITFHEWYERLRSLPHKQRWKVQKVFREQENLFFRIYGAMKASAAAKPETQTQAFVPVRPPRLIAEATSYLNSFFTSFLKYLGPLRDAPKPVYPLIPAAAPDDVGLRGEHTASILELHKNKKIPYIPATNFKDPVVKRKTVNRSLEVAVIDWLQYLGVASSVKSSDRGKLGHELKVGLANSDSIYDLTHVGVGVSQVLPILVLCLLAETDSTLVFEQPELHLHPKVQTLLGDFFLSMALCNKQCIVETHSEYLIDRLRFRIAAASPENELHSQTKIYFVEKPLQDSLFREVVINEYGAISEWPDGFFDQSQQQAEDILMAATIKRKASMSNKDA